MATLQEKFTLATINRKLSDEPEIKGHGEFKWDLNLLSS